MRPGQWGHVNGARSMRLGQWGQINRTRSKGAGQAGSGQWGEVIEVRPGQ